MSVFRSEMSCTRQNCCDDSFLHPPMYPRHILQPYSDEGMFVNPTKYTKPERTVDEIDDEILGKYVDRILLSVAMKEAGQGENFGISKSDIEYRVLQSATKSPQSGKNQKIRKKDKRNKKKTEKRQEEEDMTCDETVQHNGPTGQTITLPVEEFRKMVNAEIESRAARIHSFYQQQWNASMKDRIEAYGQVVWWKENFQKTEIMFLKVETELNKLKASYDSLQKELTSIKDAKRKRRNAAKTRRNNKDTNNNENEENQPSNETHGAER